MIHLLCSLVHMLLNTCTNHTRSIFVNLTRYPRQQIVEHQPASILYEALVSEWHLAGFAAETLGVPVVVHGFNDSANDELPTLATARGKQDMEVVLTVLAAFKLVEDSIRKWAEALTANKAGLVPNLAMGVDNLLVGFKPVPTAGTGHRFERHQEVCFSLFF